MVMRPLSSRAPIAITGVGAISALGDDVATLWGGLLAGRRGMSKIRGFDTTGCRVEIAAEASDPELAGVRLPAGTTTRSARFAIHAASQALAQAGLGPDAIRGCGLVVGSTGSGDAELEAYLERLQRRPRDRRASAARLLRYPKRALTDTVGDALGQRALRATVNTACSSGVVALIHAMDWLRAGLCDVAVAGGADQVTRYTLTGFCSLRAVDPEPCRPFDRARRGMTLGEGAGFLVLERSEDAARRGAPVLAHIIGAGQACDAHHLTAPDPDGRGAGRAIARALEEAGRCAEEVGFVNAHGTGTPQNDLAEARAIRQGLGEHALRCPTHSAKASIGHCLGAAGSLETLIAVQSVTRGLVPPTAGLVDPEPEGDFVMGAPRPSIGPLGLTTSFGFGGNDACLLLERRGGA